VAVEAAVTARPTNARYGAFAFTLVMIAIAYLDRVCISTAAPSIQGELGLSDAQMSLVFSAFTLAYALFEIPSGWLADRFGARVALSRIVVWWSAMTAATGFTGGFASLAAVRFLFGAGEAGALPSCARIYGCWLPARLHGRSFGVQLMAAAFGGAVTQPLVVALLTRIGWRLSFAVFGAVGLVWSALFWMWFRDDPRAHPSVNPAELALIEEGGAHTAPHAPVPWRALATNRTLTALCGMYFCAIYGWYFYITWLPTYLLRARGFDLQQVGWLAALPLLGIGLGSLTGGFAADHLRPRFGKRRGSALPGLVGLPLAAGAVCGAALTTEPLVAALLLASAAALAAVGVAPAWAVCVEIGGTHSATVGGTMNTFGNIGGALCPVVMGFLVQRLGSWGLPLASISVLYLAAGAFWASVDPARAIGIQDR
jgi:ACS family glucarate transporter-like MFS transporter